MSMSHYEVQVMLGCLECKYADQDKLKEMKKFHDQEDWINCGNVKGSCTFPSKRDLQKNEDGTLTCLEATKGDDQE